MLGRRFQGDDGRLDLDRRRRRTLVRGGRRLSVGKGAWAVTDWTFDQTNVEPLFANCGAHKIAANENAGKRQFFFRLFRGL